MVKFVHRQGSHGRQSIKDQLEMDARLEVHEQEQVRRRESKTQIG